MALGVLAAHATTAVLALALFQGASPRASIEERLARHRNLGKAFFENPTTQPQAVAEFKQALGLAPNSARERLNYALALLAAGRTAEGVAELEKVQRQDPKLPHTWFNLGVQYKKLGEYDRAAAQFAGMLKLVPDEPVSHYNLGTLHKLAGRSDDAIKEFEAAAKLDPNLAAPRFQLFNMYRQTGRRDDSQRELQAFQVIKKRQEGAAVPEDMEWSFYSEIHEPIDEKAATADRSPPVEPRFMTRVLKTASPTKAAQLVVLDYNNDRVPDLLAIAQGKLLLFTAAPVALTDPALAAVRDPLYAAPGDYNNDGYPDLCVITSNGAILFTNNKGRFSRTSLPAPPGNYRAAVWLDYDHDYDLDLLVLGDTPVLLRNQGETGWIDRTADFPFARNPAVTARAFRVIPDSKGFDLAITYRDRPAVLYRDRLAGKYEAQPLPAIPAGAKLIEAADADANGAIDVLFESGGKLSLALNRNGVFTTTGLAGDAPAVFADIENRAVQDVVAADGIHYLWGRQPASRPVPVPGALAYAAADLNSDGKIDIAAITKDGAVQLLTNQSPTANRYLRVALAGVKNLKLGQGAEVEVKAGVRYQKKIYKGAPLHFGLRNYAEADTVRITWPNGLIQSEARQPVSRLLTYKEAQRLSGSCPQVFAWNGSEFVYITDVLGVAPLGAAAGDGTYFPVDSLDHIQIPSAALQPSQAKYEIRVTEELAEIAYIDQVRLIAVDHPAATQIYINEKFQAPPYPSLRIWTVARRQVIPNFNAAGFTMPKTDLLLLTGWVDWPDASMFRGKSQSGVPYIAPSLEVSNGEGKWRTVIEDIGLPAGKPKTIVVEVPESVRGKRVRLHTNMPVHWLSAAGATSLSSAAQTTAVGPSQASLTFRGFSRAAIDPDRRQPERFFYPNPQPASMWNPTPGLYTRYGPATDLLATPDDRFVIMGSGDELALSFEATAFPRVAPGHQRSFVLAVDGWAKDSDPNTAYSQSVEPLPFHGMTAYPYGASERFPDTAAHRVWRSEYNTRPALRPLRPLTLHRPSSAPPQTH